MGAYSTSAGLDLQIPPHHRTEESELEYVNFKGCRSQFRTANAILFDLSGGMLGALQGLDGVFDFIWEALEDYPEWTVLVLDEIDHIKQDSNYDPNEFFYRLVGREGKLERGLNLSVFLISNELLEVDLCLDCRVQSAMDGEEVFLLVEAEFGVVSIVAEQLHECCLLQVTVRGFSPCSEGAEP